MVDSTSAAVYPQPWASYALAAGDFSLKYRGFALHAEWMARKADKDSALLESGTKVVRVWSRSAWGAHLQAGHMLTPWLQLAVRMARLRRIGGTDPALMSLDELAVAATLHLRGNDLKATLEFSDRYVDKPAAGALAVRAQLGLYW